MAECMWMETSWRFLCGSDNLVIGEILSPQKDTHKLKWVSAEYHINCIVINGKWKRSIHGVRVRREADIGSAHHLVTATIRLTWMKVLPMSTIKRFDVGKLGDNKIKQDLELGN